MDVGINGVKSLKENTLQPFPEQFKLKAGALWSGKCFPGILRVHSSLWKIQWINTSTHLSLQTISTHICALVFLRMMAATSRTMRIIAQLAWYSWYVRGSESTRMSLPFSVGPSRSGCPYHGSSFA
ncbi:hypothetical protein TNIN_347241 [Trichonephila inaurata madagascariensis]|uniref:Uncharacterized protein n=1 Tax=Trichonephila inaurata madagascariensis TaxID=2747483 RepID=A0A8X7CPK4_9ARAC|nr:hypothetical protein TNIN_347241 [Trichonephila inaurata madagascariensis]